MAEIPGYRPSIPPPGPQEPAPLDQGGAVAAGQAKRRFLRGLAEAAGFGLEKLAQARITNDLAHAELYAKEQRNDLRTRLRDSSYENWEGMHQQASAKIREDALKLVGAPAAQSAFIKWYDSSDEDLRFDIANDAKTLALGEEKLKTVELLDGMARLGDGQVAEINRVLNAQTGRLFTTQEKEALGQHYRRQAFLAGARQRTSSVDPAAAVDYLMDRNNEPDLVEQDREGLIRDIRDQKTWQDARKKEEQKTASWTAFEKVYTSIQNGEVSTYSQIDSIPELIFEDKMRADAFRRAWLSDQEKEEKKAGELNAKDFAGAKQQAQVLVNDKTLQLSHVQAFNQKWGQAKEGNEYVRYLETQLGQIEGERKRRSEEKKRADATKTTGKDYLEQFHARFYRENQTPEGLRETRQWIRDKYGPSAEEPTVPRIGSDKKQAWEGMVDREIKRLESGEYKSKQADVERGRKTISGFFDPDIREEAGKGNLGAYQRLVDQRDKLLEQFDAKAEQAEDIDALVKLVMDPPQREKVRDVLTGKRRLETEAEYYRRIGLPGLAPSETPPMIQQQGGEAATPVKSLPTSSPERTVTENADRQMIGRFANFRQHNGKLALIQVGEQLQAYDNAQKAWVPVDEQAVREFYLARKRIQE